MQKPLRVACVVAVGSLTVGVANADPVDLGFTIGSFVRSYASGTDFVAWRVTSGDPFDDPGVQYDAPAALGLVTRYYSSGGLTPDTVGYERDGYPAGTPWAGDLSLFMSGAITDTVTFEEAFFDGEARLGIVRWIWDGTTMSQVGGGSATGWNPDRSDFLDSTAIPLPSSASLALVGLGACCIRRRRTT